MPSPLSFRRLVLLAIIVLVGIAVVSPSAIAVDTIDTDNDGLSDRTELLFHHTSPLNADTDGDGLSDRDEVNIHHSNPTSTDSDADGLNDFQEVTEYNTDPNYEQSDRDKLPDGEEVHTYGTDPTNADTDGDGLTDYQEVTSEEVRLNSGIYKTFTSDPLVKDMDGDGATDFEEVMRESNLTNPDTDGDGLTDGFEVNFSENKTYRRGVDPRKTDTDEDGHSDYYFVTPVSELNSSTDRIHLTKPFDTTDFSGRDSDGDGFPDRLEQQNSNLSVDTKDVVVRVVWIEGQAPITVSLLNIVDEYANSPVDNNKGIRLHFYIDKQIDRSSTASNMDFGHDAQTEVTVTGTGMHTAMYVKKVYSDGRPVAGVASVYYPGFIVGSGNTHDRGSTTMHELGHEMGLIGDYDGNFDADIDGSFDGIDSRKYTAKEYPSVMNYNTHCRLYKPNCYMYSSGTGYNDWAAIERLLESGETNQPTHTPSTHDK